MKFELTTTTARKQNFRNARVLIIDDNPDQLLLITNYIKQCLPEVEPIQARSEEEALAYLDECLLQDLKLPKLILLDIYMPRREDGWQILRRIKNLPQPANYIPVVMLSYSDSKDDIRKTYDQGGSSYLVKPTNPQEWLTQFEILRTYWWETVTLPQTGYRL